eukprot:2920870-Rhodomonas_salina.2
MRFTDRIEEERERADEVVAGRLRELEVMVTWAVAEVESEDREEWRPEKLFPDYATSRDGEVSVDHAGHALERISAQVTRRLDTCETKAA